MEHVTLVFLGLVVLVLTYLVIQQRLVIVKLKETMDNMNYINQEIINNLEARLSYKTREVEVINEALESFKKSPTSAAKSPFNKPKSRHRFTMNQKATIVKQYKKCIEADASLERLVETLNKEFGCNKSYRAYENVWRLTEQSEQEE